MSGILIFKAFAGYFLLCISIGIWMCIRSYQKLDARSFADYVIAIGGGLGFGLFYGIGGLLLLGLFGGGGYVLFFK